MKTAVIEKWLFRQTLAEAILNVPVGIVVLITSWVALALFSAAAYSIGFILFLIARSMAISLLDVHLRNPVWFCSMFAGSCLLLLFISHYRRNSEYLRNAKYRTAKVHVSDAGFARTLNILLAGPHGEDSFFEQLLYAGPQWFVSAISMFYKSVTLLRMDTRACAKLLLILFEKDSRVSLVELTKLVPEYNAVKIFPQLREIAGVIFLQSEPTGISLTSDLRRELSRVLGVRNQSESRARFHQQARSAPPPPRPRKQEEPPGPHRILGVPRTASLSEIQAAYRKQIKQCHPDRFANANKDWQLMADQRAKIINAAYAELRQKMRRDMPGMD